VIDAKKRKNGVKLLMLMSVAASLLLVIMLELLR
jgi:hypothetical protein